VSHHHDIILEIDRPASELASILLLGQNSKGFDEFGTHNAVQTHTHTYDCSLFRLNQLFPYKTQIPLTAVTLNITIFFDWELHIRIIPKRQ
jgi:hypothetical protein